MDDSLDAICYLLVADPWNWQQSRDLYTRDVRLEHTGLHYRIFLVDDHVRVDYRLLGWWDKRRLRKALAERDQKLVTQYLLQKSGETE